MYDLICSINRAEKTLWNYSLNSSQKKSDASMWDTKISTSRLRRVFPVNSPRTTDIRHRELAGTSFYSAKSWFICLQFGK